MSISSICGVVTTYNPKNNFLLNLQSYIYYLHKVYIVDNSVDIDADFYLQLSEKYKNIHIVSFGRNIGVAAALNYGIKQGIENNYSWLLTMDQDSFFDAEQAKLFFSSISYIDKNCVAILSPSHKPVLTIFSECEYVQKDEVMTSGNLLNLALVDKIGFYNDDLFIDSVDHDYCLRSNLLGFKILQATNCYLNHTVGELYHGTLFGGKKKKNFQIHSPKRMYFIVRNGLYLRKRYKRFFAFFLKSHQKNILHKISRCLRYSPQRWEYLRYILKGYWDFYHNKFGNRVDI